VFGQETRRAQIIGVARKTKPAATAAEVADLA
jgi:hypothetical protein